MTLNEYQEQAMKTCMSSSYNFAYMMLNLVGEVGEFASKVAKAIRKDKVVIIDNVNEYTMSVTPEEIDTLKGGDKAKALEITEREALDMLTFDNELKKEAGDIIWQLAGLCTVMGWSLEDVAMMNLDKLSSRQQRGKIDGDGDNR